jgi:hypothetical protein
MPAHKKSNKVNVYFILIILDAFKINIHLCFTERAEWRFPPAQTYTEAAVF